MFLPKTFFSTIDSFCPKSLRSEEDGGNSDRWV